MEKKEKLFIRGFNVGYTLRKNHPLLMKTLYKSIKEEDEYLKGMLAGKKEYEREIQKQVLKYRKSRKHHGNRGREL